jgi:hypothetical protein
LNGLPLQSGDIQMNFEPEHRLQKLREILFKGYFIKEVLNLFDCKCLLHGLGKILIYCAKIFSRNYFCNLHDEK